MKIKEASNDHKVIRDIWKLIRSRKIIKLFFLILIAFGISGILVSFGIFLNRNHKIQSLVHFSADLYENKLAFVGNYYSSFDSNPHQLQIDIKFKHSEKINQLLNSASDKGMITSDLKDHVFPAKIIFNGKKYRVKLSLTGQYLDHIKSDRNSFNVEVKDDETILGMSKFKLLIPSTRGYLADWIGHELQKKEGLIVPRYDFVNLKINGENKGIFGIEESYNTDLIEYNEFRDGIIFKPDLKGIIVLNKKKISRDLSLQKRVISLKNLWQGFLNGEIKPEDLFDLEKFAVEFATSDLIAGLHSKFMLNLRYYYNPVTNLIEPISREFGFMRNGYAITGQQKTQILLKYILENNEQGNQESKYYKKIFDSPVFKMLYVTNLNRIAQKQYLDRFFKSIEDIMYEKEKIIFRENPFYSYPKRFIYENQTIISDFLYPSDQVLFADLLDKGNDKLSLTFTNKSFLPIKINYILINDSIISRPFDKNIVPSIHSQDNESHVITFNSVESGIINDKNVRYFYNFVGLDSAILEHRVSKINGINTSYNPATMSHSFLELDFVIIDSVTKTVTIPKGNYTFDKFFTIPSSYMVNFNSGVNIDFINNGGLNSYSSLNFIGTKELPIHITSSDLKNKGISVIKTTKTSNFSFVKIENLSNFNSNDWNLTGALTFYEADVIFNSCQISNNISGDDLLNIFNSTFEIINSEFNNSLADALDADFCHGEITNTVFNNSGNDAIDISGSYLFVENVTIDESLDKALSAGENSKVMGNNLKIVNSEIAICSKDLSEIIINGYFLENNRIALTAFQKKPKFGPGVLNMSNGIFKINQIDHLIESNSTYILDGNSIPGNVEDVNELFYGKKFGKSSK